MSRLAAHADAGTWESIWERWALELSGTSTSGEPMVTGFPRPGECLARLDEGVQIIKQARTTGASNSRKYPINGVLGTMLICRVFIV